MANLTLVKNAFANLCRGGASALVALLLPLFLTRIIDKDVYGTWLLILQLSTYVGFLDFGIQTAVGRYVAHCNELGDIKQRDSIVSTSLVILSVAGVFAIAGISLLAWQLPNLFKDMPFALHRDAQLALLFVGYSLAISLPFNVFGSIFVGMQRYDVPAWIIGSGKLLGGIFVVLMAQSSHSIVLMGIVMGVANLLTGFWQYFAYRQMARDIKVSFQKVSRNSVMEITNYCAGLIVWSMGMILVSGLDATIIGYFDYKSVVYYTLAASLINFIVGIQSSIFTTMLPNAAALGARKDGEGLGKLLISSTRYATITLILTNLPLILGGKWILTLWIGESYAMNTLLLLQMLLIANFIRQLGTPYAIITMAVGEQKLIMLSPCVEGIINLLISIILVKNIGVNGVAIGTITGGLISLLSHLFYNLPRTKNIVMPSVYPLLLAIIKPSAALLPLILLSPWLYEDLKQSPSSTMNMVSLFLSLIAAMLTFAIMYFYVITNNEKSKLISFIKHTMKNA
jgi:O-antigen/teichoic acid export membrane protein